MFLSDDGGKMCTPDDTSCDGFDLAPDLVAFKGYASAAHDPKGRSFILTLHSYDRTPNLLIVSFDGKGKRLASWSSPQDCTEQAGVVLGRVAVMPCRGEDDKVGVYSSLVVHELATGKVRSRLRGSFRDSASLVVDDARFATWLPDDHSLALYHLADPDHPKVVWQTRLDLEAPALATAAGGIVAIAAENPWKGIILDAGTGKPKHTFHVDPCRP